MLSFLQSYNRFQDDQTINLSENLNQMRQKEYVSKLDEMRLCFKSISKLNKYQKGVILLDVVIRAGLILNFVLSEECSMMLQIAFYSCIAQTVSTLLTSNTFYKNSFPLNNHTLKQRFSDKILLLLQIDSKYILIDLVGYEKQIKNEKEYVPICNQQCQNLYLWICVRRLFIMFRMMVLLGEMQQGHSYNLMLILGVMQSVISIILLNYIFTKAIYLSIEYKLRETLLIMLELISSFVQSFLNILVLISSSIFIYILSIYALFSFISHLIKIKFPSLMMPTTIGFIDHLFLGQKLCFVTPLLKKDMKQYNIITCNYWNALHLFIYAVLQIVIVKYFFLNDDQEQHQIISVLQIKFFAINFILFFVQGYLMKGLYKSQQSYQAEDIIMAEQYRNKQHLRVYIQIKSEQQLFIQEDDSKVLQEMMQQQIEEFYLSFEREFEIYSKRGNTFIKINSIRNQEEIERVYLALLHSSKTIDFEIDKDLVSLPKLDKFMYLLLRNCIFIDEIKMLIKKEELLSHFERYEINYTSFVQEFNSTCPAIIQLATYYKYITNQIKIKPLLLLQDITS